MCLLVVFAGVDPARPLVVGANRDEYLDRPATPMTVLQASGPRIVGGRDELAHGTWLAVNEHGVVAGLTNRPAGEAGRDTTKRSRGELPLALAQHATAAAAVDAFATAFRPTDYNAAWLLVGDRDALFTVDMTDGDVPVVTELARGTVHLLENKAYGEPSEKIDAVRAALDGVDSLPAALATDAACIHLEGYGTRWSAVVTVGADRDVPPSIRCADGPPCRTAYVEATGIWTAAG